MVSANSNVPCVTVRTSGGLGNQLFQYAVGRSLAITRGAKLVLDATFYDPRRHRRFELDQFPIEAEVRNYSQNCRIVRQAKAFGKKLFRVDPPEYREPHFHFDPSLLAVRLPVVLAGYFQSPRYFELHADLIRRELAPPQPLDAESLELAEVLCHQDSVTLHVRRGDYVSNPKARETFYECSAKYYQDALQRVPGNGPVVVVSDDISWARENLPRTRPMHFAGEKGARSGLADLWLMAQGKHHIIANSTFSWWGAWLSTTCTGTTVAPRHWFRTSKYDTRDLLPKEWSCV